jgi:hypothetical protein
MEQGYGLMTIMHQINEYREEEDLPDVSISTVCHTINRIGPVLRKLKRKKRKQRPNLTTGKCKIELVNTIGGYIG